MENIRLQPMWASVLSKEIEDEAWMTLHRAKASALLKRHLARETQALHGLTRRLETCFFESPVRQLLPVLAAHTQLPLRPAPNAVYAAG